MIRSSHLLQNAEPGDSGSTPVSDAPVIDNSLSAPEPAATPAAPVDPMAGLRNALDAVGQDAPAEPANGQPRDPLGRFAPTTPQATPTPTAAPVPAATPTPTAAPVAQKPEDDLTPPEGLSERAQQRFSQMAERIKTIPQLEQRAQEATQALDSVRTMVRDSGLAPQEFSEMLDMARLFKSGNPQDLQSALKQLDGLRTDVARRLGTEVPGVDLLADHADLQQKVSNMLLSREDALEIARLRGTKSQHESLTREQQDYQQHQQAVQSATVAMQTELSKRAGTPGHEAKLKAIDAFMKDPAKLQQFVTTYRPEQWAATLGIMYDNIQVPAPVAATPAGPQPLRPGSVRSGAPVVNGPVTAHSAIDGAFAAIGM